MQLPPPRFDVSRKLPFGHFSVGFRSLRVTRFALIAWDFFAVPCVSDGILAVLDLFFTLGNAMGIGFKSVHTVKRGRGETDVVVVVAVVVVVVVVAAVVLVLLVVVVLIIFVGVFVGGGGVGVEPVVAGIGISPV